MKAFKKFKSMTNQGDKFGGEAVKVLRKMPMWQRIVSAIVAFLLVFLLWPADAAKTITAWANDAETQVATEEGVTDPDPESPDPGGGGEESDDPEVDPETPDQPEVAGPVLETDSTDESTETEEDSGTLNAAGPEACGAYVWDFSAYTGNKKTIKTKSDVASYEKHEYNATGKAAKITFIDPFSTNNNTLDGGSTTISTSGFEMNSWHKLNGDGLRYDTNGEIYSNYIIIKPNESLRNITLSIASKNKYGNSEYAILGAVPILDGKIYSSQDFCNEVDINWTSFQDVTLAPKEGTFEKDKSYAIYFRPKECSYSDYYKYGGVKINKIKADVAFGNFEFTTKNVAVDDTIEVAYADAQANIYRASFKNAKDEEYKFTSEQLPPGQLKGLRITSVLLNKVFEYPAADLPTIIGDDTVTLSDIDFNEFFYKKITGQIDKDFDTSIGVTYLVEFGNYYSAEVSCPPNSQTVDFTIPCFFRDGKLKISVKESTEAGKKFEEYEAYISYQGGDRILSPIKIGDKNVPNKYKLSFDTDPSGQDITKFLKVTKSIEWLQWLNPIVNDLFYAEVYPEADGTYLIESGAKIKLETTPSSIWFADTQGATTEVGREFEMPASDKHLYMVVPVYNWVTSPDGTASCTGDFNVLVSGEVIHKTETVTTEDEENPITWEIPEGKRPTSTSPGEMIFTANFSQKNIFTMQTKTVVLPAEETHEHEGYGRFDKLDPNVKQIPSSGTWYLDSDISVNQTTTIEKNKTLVIDLNGYALSWDGPEQDPENVSHIFFHNQGTLEIIDCKSGAAYCPHNFSVDATTGQWKLDPNGEEIIYGGVITGANNSAVYNEKTFKSNKVHFVGNANMYQQDEYPAGAGGGAIRSGSTSQNPTMDLTECSFKGNVSGGTGGAVLVGVSNKSCYAGTANINDCEFTNNKQIGDSTSTSGYEGAWGGGALSTFSIAQSPTIYVHGCKFFENTSKYRAGAVFLFHGTTCYMSDCTIQNNTSGLHHETVTDEDLCYNYGGGLNVYTGYGSENKNQCNLWLSGTMNITNNMSREYKDGVENYYEDNLALQLQSDTKGYINIDPNNPLKEDSLVGVNYAKNTDLDISKGYGSSMLDLNPGSQDLTDPSVKCFVLDEVVGRLSYELLVNTKIGNSKGSYELWIVPHQHQFTYTTSKSKPGDQYEVDTLSVKCGTGQVQRDIITGYGFWGNPQYTTYTFSKCKYGEELSSTIRSRDGGEELDNMIPYDGKEHPVEITNYYELLNHAFAVPSGNIQYWGTDLHQAEENAHTTWAKLTSPPVEPGCYRAAIGFYDVQIKNGELVVDRSKEYQIGSNLYYIKGTEVTVEVPTVQKTYDGSTSATVNEAHIIDGLVGDDVNNVSVELKYDYAEVYAESPYVGLQNISGYNISDFKLTGSVGNKYSIGKVVGFVNIKPADQSVTNGEFTVVDGGKLNLQTVFGGNFSNNAAFSYYDHYDGPDPDNPISYDGIIKFDPLDPTNTTFSVVKQEWPEGRYKRLKELETGSQEVWGVELAIYVKDVSAVRDNPDESAPYDYNGVSYDDPRIPDKNYVRAHGYIICQGPGYLNINLLEDGSCQGQGQFIDSSGQWHNSITLSRLNLSKDQVMVRSEDGTSLEFTDGINTYKIRYVPKDSTKYQFFKLAYMDGGKLVDVTGDYKKVFTVADDQFNFYGFLWELPDPKIEAEINFPHKEYSVGDKVEFNITIKNNSGKTTLYGIDGPNTGLRINWESKYGEHDYIDTEIKEIPIKGQIVYNYLYTVTSEDVASGGIQVTFTVEGSYINSPTGDSYAYIETEPQTISVDTVAIQKKIAIGITATPVGEATIPVHVGEQIHYTAKITNQSNVNITDAVVSSELLGLIGDNAIPIGTEVDDHQIFYIGQSVEIDFESHADNYTVDGEDVAAGTVVNTVSVAGYVYRSAIEKETISDSATSNTKVDYSKVPKPTATPDLVYDGTSKQGIHFDIQTMVPDANYCAIDAGKYYTTVTLKDWYKWDDDDPSTTYTVQYEIKPATINVQQFTIQDTENDIYNGVVKSHSVLDKFPDPEAEDTPWAPGEGLASAKATTTGVNAGVYTHNPTEGEATIQVALTPNANTNLANYNIIYAKDSTIEIYPYSFDNDDIVVNIEKDLVYNAQDQNVRFTVVDKRFGGEAGRVLVKDQDYLIVDESDEGHDASSYTLKVTGKEGSNYSTEKTKEKAWKITQASLSLKVVANSNIVEYNGQVQSIEGYNLTVVSNPQNLPIDGKITPVDVKTEATDVGTYEALTQEVKDSFIYNDTTDNVAVTWAFEGGILKITPVDITNNGKITVTPENDLVYNADTQTNNFVVEYTPDGAPKLTLVEGTDYEVSGNTAKNAGNNYKGAISAKGNYVGNITNIIWGIAQYPITVTAEAETQEYKGEAYVKELTYEPFTAQGFTDKITIRLTTNSSNVGTYQTVNGSLIRETIPAEGTLLNNFAFTYNNIEFTIKTKQLVVTPESKAFTYDGYEHRLATSDITVEGLCDGHIIDFDNGGIVWVNNSATNVNAPDGQEVSISDVVVTNANSQSEATRYVTNNYEIITYTATLTINKADMYIDIYGNVLGSEDAKIYYDGKEHTAIGYKASIDEEKTNPQLQRMFETSKISPARDMCIAKGIAAGTHEMKIYKDGAELDFVEDNFSYADSDNFNVHFNVSKGKVEIQKHVLTVTVNDSKYYDPDEAVHEKFVHWVNVDKSAPGNMEVVGLAENEELESIKLETVSADEGVYDELNTEYTSNIEWGTVDKANYILQYYVVLTIQELQIITVAGTRTNDTYKKYYTGYEQFEEGYTVSSSKGEAFFHPEALKIKKECEYKTKVTGTNAGTYWMGLQPSDFYYDYGDEPYQINVEDGMLEITPKELEDEMLITPEPVVFEYNGQIQGPTFTLVNVSGGKTVQLTDRDFEVTEGTATDVDTYQANIIGRGNYTGTLTPINWAIVPADVNFTIVGNNDTRTYNGQDQTVSGYTVSVDKLRPYIDTENKLTLDDPTKDDVTSKFAGTYFMRLDEDSFKYVDKNINPHFTIVQGYIKINPKNLSEIDISLNPNEYIYNGADKAPEVVIKDGATTLDNEKFVIDGTTHASAAGNYSITVTPSNREGNYEGSVTLPWVINKAFIEVDITGTSSEFEYDGNAKTVTGFDAVLASGSSLDAFHKGHVQTHVADKAKVSGTNAGLYYMGLLVSDFYYDDSSVNAKFNIIADGSLNIKPISINDALVSATPLSFAYKGSEQGPDVTASYNSKTLIPNKDYYLYGAKAINAGDYTLTVDGTGNFKDSKEFTWSIEKAKLHAAITGNSVETTYNGALQTASGWEATYTPSSPEYNFTVYPLAQNVYASGTNVGTYPMKLYETEFSISDPNNIDFTYDVVADGKLTIKGIDLTNCIVTAENRIYNGKEQYTKIIVKDTTGNVYTEGVDYEVVSGASATEANDSITATIKGLGKCSGQTTVNWKMLKANITAVIIGDSKTFTYDGAEHEVSSYNVVSESMLFNQGKVKHSEGEITSAKRTDVGITYLTIDSTKFSYEDQNVICAFVVADESVETPGVQSGKIEIKPAQAYISSKAAKPYDGTTFSPSSDQIIKSGFVGVDLTSCSLTTNDSQIGTYYLTDDNASVTANLTWKGITTANNYEIHYDVELTITQAEKYVLTITGNHNEFTYDGHGHNVNDYTYTSTPTIPELNVTLKTGYSCNITKVDAGTYYMGMQKDWFDIKSSQVKVDDIEVVIVDGYLKINPIELKPSMVQVSPTQFTYNSTEQGPGVTVMWGDYYLTPNDYDVVSGRAIDAGNYNMTITGKGNFTGSVSGISWQIAKADLTLTVNETKEFDGNIFNYEIIESDMKGNYDRDGMSAKLSTNSADVGVYTPGDEEHNVFCNFTGVGINNYNIINHVTLKIEKRHLTVTPESKVFSYTGYEQKLSNDELVFDNLAPHHSVTNIVWNDNNGITNVGKQDNVAVKKVKIVNAAQQDVTDSYTIDYESASITINKSSIKIHVEGNKDVFAYDGSPHSVSGYKSWEMPATEGGQVLGVYKPEKLIALSELKVTAVEPKDGEDPNYYMGKTAENFVYEDANVDYAIDYVDGYINITRNSFDAATITARDFVYDGKPHTTDVIVSINGNVLKLGEDYRIAAGVELTQTLAGSYPIEIEGIGKYKGATKTGSWQITKANMVIALYGKNSIKEYTGEEQVFPEEVSVGNLCTAMETSATGLFNFNNINLQDGYEPQVKGSELGTYTVGLDVSKFTYNDENINAQFVLATDAYMQIVSADISKFIATADNFVYNAAEQTTSVALKNGDKDLVYGTDYVVEGQLSGTNVGTYYAKVTGINNYKGTIINVPWNITKAQLTIQIIANEKSVEYNGYSQTVTGYSATPTGGATNLFVAGDILLVKGKQAILSASDVGDYELNLESTDFAYDNPNIEATFTGSNETNAFIAVNRLHIYKKALTLHAVDVKTQDGVQLTHRITTADFDGTVAGQVLSGYIYTLGTGAKEYTGNELQTDMLKIDGKPTNNANADDPTENYQIINLSKLTITDPEVDSVYITGITKSFEYNGQEQSISSSESGAYTITTNMTDFDMSKLHINGTFNLKATNVADSKTSSVTATYDQDDVNVVVTQSNINIEKRSLAKATLNYDQQTFTYNNADQYPSKESFTLTDFDRPLGDSSFKYIVPEAGTSVIPGHYSLELNADAVSSSNYKDSIYLTYDIVKAYRVVEVNGHILESVYTGQEMTVSGFDVNEIHGEEAAVIDPDHVKYATPLSVKATDAGIYQMGMESSKVSYDAANKDYVDISFVVNDGYLKINAVDISDFEIEVDTLSFIYNAKAQGPTVTRVSKDGFVVDAKYYDVVGNSEINANTFAKENYELKVIGKGNFTGQKIALWNINKAQRNVTITGNSASLTYRGVEQSVVGWTAVEDSDEKVVNASLISPAYSSCIAKGKDVGVYNMNLKANNFAYGDANNVDVTFTVTDGSLTITKCDINDISFVGYPEQIIYNGKPQSPTIQLTNGDVPLTENTDYILGGEKSAIYVKYDATGAIDNYTLSINANNSKNYFGEKEFVWSIVPLPVDIYINGKQLSTQFTGEDITVSDFTYDTSLSDELETLLISKDKMLFDEGGVPSITGRDVDTYKKYLSSEDFTYDDENITANFIINNDVQLVITPKDISQEDIIAEEVHYIYTSFEIEASLILKDDDYQLVEGEDFVAYNNKGTNAGTYTAYVEGINNYCGQKMNIKWYIDQAQLDVIVDGNQKVYTYNPGSKVPYSVNGYTLTCENYPNLTGLARSLVYAPSQYEFQISRTNEEIGPLKEDDYFEEETIALSKFPTIENANVKLNFKQGQKLKLTVKAPGATDISTCHLADYVTEYTYNGAEQGPTITVQNEGGTPLKPGIDYNIVGTTKATDVSENAFKVKVVGIGLYYGEINGPDWMIVPKPITTPLTYDDYYSATQLKHAFTLGTAQGIVAGQSFDVVSKTMDGVNEGIDAGSYTYPTPGADGKYATCDISPSAGFVSTSLMSNYSFDFPITLTIKAKPFSEDYINITGTNQNYNGKEQFVKDFKVTDKTTGRVLTKDVDYTLSGDVLKKDHSVNDYTVTVTPKAPNYTGEARTYKWNINQIGFEGSVEMSKQYNGQKFNTGNVEVSTGIFNEKLIGVWETNGNNVGTYTLPESVSQIGNWSAKEGTNLINYNTDQINMSVTLKIGARPIDPNSPDFTINVSDLTYDGNNQTPTVEIRDGDKLLGGSDYSWGKKEEETKDVGTYHIIVTGNGNYSTPEGGIELEWNIFKRDLTAYCLTGNSPYSGNYAEASKTLTGPTDINLVSGESITLYAKTKDVIVGEYRYDGTEDSSLDFTITPVGTTKLDNYNYNFTGKVTIGAIDLSEFSVTYTDELTYNGRDQRPDQLSNFAVVDTNGNTVDPSEYEVVGAYHKNVEDDDFSFVVKAKAGGNYSGQTESQEWRLLKKSITALPTFNESKVYDRDLTGYSVAKTLEVANGLIPGEKLLLTAIAHENGGPAVNVGEYTGNDLTFEWTPGNTSTLLSNYDYSNPASGKLEITKRAASFMGISGSTNFDSDKEFVKTFTLDRKTGTGILEGDEFTVEFTTYKNSAKCGDVGVYTYGNTEGNYLELTNTEGDAFKNYEMTFGGTLTINGRSIDPSQNGDIDWTKVNPIYSGLKDRTPQLTITDKKQPLTAGTHYTVEVEEQKDVLPDYALKYQAKIKGNTSEGYNGEFIIRWNVDPKPVDVDLSDSKDYDAKEYHKDNISIEDLYVGDSLLAEVTTYKYATTCGEVGTYNFVPANDDTYKAIVEITEPNPGENPGQTIRNYKLNYTGSIVINPRSLNPDYIKIAQVVSGYTYDGKYYQPQLTINDITLKSEPVPLVLGTDYEFASAPQKDVPETTHIAVIKGKGNYSSTSTLGGIEWTIVPTDFSLNVEAEKYFDGEVFEYSGIANTGINEDAFTYTYVTKSAEVGTYVWDEDETDVEEVVLEAAPGTLGRNYNEITDKNVTLRIVEAPVPPQPEPDVPEYVPGQTGDSTPVAGFAIMALTLIGAFLLLRRPKKVQGLHIR